MGWITRGGEVLAVVDECSPGWQHRLVGAVVLRSPALVRSFDADACLDVAWCTSLGAGGLRVRRMSTLGRWRPVAPCVRTSTALLVAKAGSFERWHLAVGDEVRVDGT